MSARDGVILKRGRAEIKYIVRAHFFFTSCSSCASFKVRLPLFFAPAAVQVVDVLRPICARHAVTWVG
jgi:hypothetical protein